VKEGLGGEAKKWNNSVGVFGWDGMTVLCTLEMAHIWRDIGKGQVVHTFIKTSMKGNLHALGFGVIPKDVLGGVGCKAEKDSTFGVILQATCTFSRRANPDATSKSTNISEIGLETSMKTLKVRRGVVSAWQRILDPEKMIESAWPKLRVEIRSSQERTQSIANRLMRALHRSVLMRGVGASRVDIITEFLEEIANLGVVIEFPTLIHVNVLV
jgi:hypothetical protein